MGQAVNNLIDIPDLRFRLAGAQEQHTNRVFQKPKLEALDFGPLLAWLEKLTKQLRITDSKPELSKLKLEESFSAQRYNNPALAEIFQRKIQQQVADRLIYQRYANSKTDTLIKELESRIEKPLSIADRAEVAVDLSFITGSDREHAVESYLAFKTDVFKKLKELSSKDRIMSDFTGKINSLVFQAPFANETLKTAKASTNQFNVIKALDAKMDTAVKFVFAVHPDAAKALQETVCINKLVKAGTKRLIGETVNGRTIELNVFEPETMYGYSRSRRMLRVNKLINMYARDSFVRLAGGDSLYPEIYPLAKYYQVPDYYLDYSRKTTDTVTYDGGDIRAGDKIVFIGRHAIDGVEKTYGVSTAEAVTRLEKALGKKVVLVQDLAATEPPTIFKHLDMFFTPIADNEVIVAKITQPEDELYKDYWQGVKSDYLESTVAYLQEQMPHLKIHRVEMPSIDALSKEGNFSTFLLSYNNCLTELKWDDEKQSRKLTLYVPDYDFTNELAELEASRNYFLKLEGDGAKVNFELNWLDKAINTMKANFNEAHIQVLRDKVSRSQYLDTEIVPVPIAASFLNVKDDAGGSLRCLTNEFRSKR